MSAQTANSKLKEHRPSVNITKTNRSEDKKLERRVEQLNQRDRRDQARHCSEIKKLEKELESMQMQVKSPGRTFTRREIEEKDVAYLFGKKKRAVRKKRRYRGDSAEAALNRVVKNVEVTSKNKFRSAVMAVCVANRLGAGDSEDGTVVVDLEGESDAVFLGEGSAVAESRIPSAQSRLQRERMRMLTYPSERPYTSRPALQPPPTTHDGKSRPLGSARSINSRRETCVSLSAWSDSPQPTAAVSLPNLAGAARASFAHSAESAKAAALLKQRGSGVYTATAAEQELERRRSSAALRLRGIKEDLSRRDSDLQDRVRLFIKTSMPGEKSTVNSLQRMLAMPVGGEPSSTDIND